MATSKKKRFARTIIKIFKLSSLLLKLYPLSVEQRFSTINLAQLNALRSLFPLNITKEVIWKRFGSRFDGGYLLIDDVSKSDICLSIGIGDNFSFDQDIGKICREVQMFDHTIESPEINSKNLIFHNIGISVTSASGFMTLEEILKDIPAENDLILKLDIEGTEWDVLNMISEEHLTRFRQIVVEFHELFQIGNDQSFSTILNSLTKVSKTHHLMNLHANNWATFHLIEGVPLPDVIEATYLRRVTGDSRQYRIVPLNKALNDPNNQDLPDYQLNFLSHVEI